MKQKKYILNTNQKKLKKAQIGMEYLIIMGFITFIIIGIMGLAMVYTGSVKDRIKTNQITSFADKIISTSEAVFYKGSPSKATIETYLPENINEISIQENSLVINISTSTGINILSFKSNVPIQLTGSINPNQGIKNIIIQANENTITISQS